MHSTYYQVPRKRTIHKPTRLFLVLYLLIAVFILYSPSVLLRLLYNVYFYLVKVHFCLVSGMAKLLHVALCIIALSTGKGKI